MSSTEGGGEHIPKPHIISPAGFTHLCRSSGHQGVWEGRDRPRGRVQPMAHALNTTRNPFAAPVGLLGPTDTSATAQGSCHPNHVSWWDKGSSNNTNSTVKTNTSKKPNPERSFCSLLEQWLSWKTGLWDCPDYIS